MATKTQIFILHVVSLGLWVIVSVKACFQNIGRKVLPSRDTNENEREGKPPPFDYVRWVFSQPKRTK